MASLLHLDSSANRSDDSVSRELTSLFADTWRAAHGPTGECGRYRYVYRDLAADPVRPLDTAYCTLGRRLERNGLPPLADVGTWIRSPAEEREWALTRSLIAGLLAADTVVIGAPMYNFSVSALLKAWIDRVGFPGVFTDPDTGASLLRATNVVVIATRGGAYGPGTPREAWDFQTPYLRTYFGKQGVTEENIHFVSVEMTMAGVVPHLAHQQSSAADSLASARAEVTALAATVGRSASRTAV
ncbi:FMN-dependent NADH-azoreductase [Streptomyces sp. NPDC127117]|uniref:FMN-dependent NADH-azoreductase n=1 Tax=Streptomyces sp. NPDC127117 TaxID=3345368 RepID=UPI00362618B1